MTATLTYHSIDPSASPISVAPDAFARHVMWLTSGSVQVRRLSDLVSASGADDAVAVTFDDGFLNIKAPVERLLDAGIPVTVFVVSGHVGGTNDWGGRPARGVPTLPLLGWNDLEWLAQRGASLEAHTRRHPALTGLSTGELEQELAGAREDLRRRLGVDAVHLAYPYGDVDETVASRTRPHYRFAHTTTFRTLRPGDDPMWLPRLDMYYFQAPGALETFGTPRFTRRVAGIRTRRAVREGLTRRVGLGRRAR